ncbi:hypothetical protein LTR66_009773 [Elasticomyces elasticus]|nr:hypothetical protein LTR66_009773 [Elasticomyces elasticus]KAK4991102.1 hypothetical protein LTR50_002032 [Elasticomyces elasticus]
MDATPAVLLLDLPPDAMGGINLLSFTTTSRFKGIKDLPTGCFHFVFTGATSTLSVRHGAWFHVPRSSCTSDPPQLLVKKWDPQREDLVEADETEKLRWRANLGSIWKEGLTPYRQSASEQAAEDGDWAQLTDCITASILSRITGGTRDHWKLSSASSAKRDMDEIPGLTAQESMFQPEMELDFLPIDLKQTWREGATGRERTEAAQDRSWALGDVVEKHCQSEMDMLGELQFCFVMVLTLNNYSCLEQWKRILSLLFTCKDATNARPNLFIKAISTLRLQLQHCQDDEGGLFDLTEDTLLGELLRRFRQGLEQLRGLEVQDVMDELDDLEQCLKDTYGWQMKTGAYANRGMLELEDGERVDMDAPAVYDPEYEEGEFAPAIVDLSPEQLKMLRPSSGTGDGHEATDTSSSEEEKDDSDEEDDRELAEMDSRY